MESPFFSPAARAVAFIQFAWTQSVVATKPGAARRFFITIGFFLFAFSNIAFTAEAPLTLTEAQRRAVERSRQIPAQDAAIAASRNMAVAAGQLPDPQLRFGIDNLPVDGPDQFSVGRDFMTQRRIGISQEFTRSEKRQLRAQRYEREAEKSLAEKTAIIATIQRQTALAWFDRYYAEAMAAVIAEQAGEVKLEISAAESAYRAGRGTQADVFAAHSALAGLEDRASEFRRRIDTARIGLTRWIGDGADTLLEGKPAIDSIALDSSSLESELGHHPQIAILSKQVEVAAIEAGIAQAETKADWTVELAYSQRGGAFSNMVSIGVSIPLQWDQKNRQDRELASRLATADRARAERDDVLRAHVAEVSTMVHEWQNNLERTARFQDRLIPLARERTKAALGAYVGNKASLTDLLLARRSEIDVRLQALQLEMEAARSWAQLNFLFPDGAGATHTRATSNAPATREAQ
ncbi:MAG: TolC family protein [Betaproteobacteria bacterium]